LALTGLGVEARHDLLRPLPMQEDETVPDDGRGAIAGSLRCLPYERGAGGGEARTQARFERGAVVAWAEEAGPVFGLGLGGKRRQFLPGRGEQGERGNKQRAALHNRPYSLTSQAVGE